MGGLRLLVFILIEYEFLGGVCQTNGWTSSTHFYLVILVESVKCRNILFLRNVLMLYNIPINNDVLGGVCHSWADCVLKRQIT